MSFSFSNGSYAVDFDENATGTVFDGEGSGTGSITYLLSGTDQALFSINSTTGVITFIGSPNFESPGDAGGNNVYDLKITAFDAGDTTITTKDVTITVKDVNEAPTAVTITEDFPSLSEITDTTTGVKFGSFAVTDDALGTNEATLTGADESLFEIKNGTEIWLKAGAILDFESNATLDIGVSVKDSLIGSAVTDTSTFSVTNVAPKMVALPLTINEGTTLVGNVVDKTGDYTNVTYSISNVNDFALFTVDESGNLSFNAAPDHETPKDIGADNTYSVTVVSASTLNVSDQAVKTYTISVNNLDDTSPTISSSNVFNVTEGSTAAFSIVASDVDTLAANLVYSITGGFDAADFVIDSKTGIVTFAATTDHENPADDGTDNVYDIEIGVSDGKNTITTQSVKITVDDANDNTPVIDTSAAASVEENQTSAYTINATDADSSSIVSYSISGTDSAFFDVNATTGVVTFKLTPDFEAKADAGNDNVYDIVVKADDGKNSSTKNVAITLTDLNDTAPVINSSTSANVAENISTATTVIDVNSTDADTTGETTVYSISGGTDSALFDINSSTGVVTFKASPDFEIKSDVGGNNVYDIIVKASDGINSSTQNIAITLTDVNDNAPVITSAASASAAEDVSNATAVYTVTKTDADTIGTYTYAISGGADMALFNIDSNTGAVTFVTSPDREAPADVGLDNIYDIQVTASDGVNTPATKNVAITVTDVNDNAPSVVASASYSINEGSTATILTLGKTDADTTPATFTYAFASGADDGLFNLNTSTGAVSFKAGEDKESPGDAGNDGTYDIKVTVSDGTFTSAVKDIAITLNDVAPKLLTTLSDVKENTTSVGSVIDTSGDTSGITYGLTNADDGALFQISNAGVISFKNAPDFENPADVGKDNGYSVTVTSDDGTTVVSQVFNFNVTNEDVLVTTVADVKENTTSAGSVLLAGKTASDYTFSVIGGLDQSLFSINSSTGILSFLAAPDFEAPGDSNKDNTYAVQVQTVDKSTGDIESSTISFNVVDNPAPAINGTSVANTLNGTNESESINGLGGNDIIFGFLGNDIIDGGIGSDKMTGGKGDDTYFANVGQTLDVITELASEGTDTVKSTVTYTLLANIENLELLGTLAISGTGNTENNKITGNSAANVLKGLTGNDVLIGGLAKDTLTGGAGNDTFTYTNLLDSKVGTTRDTITDFETVVGDNDTIDLSGLGVTGTIAAGVLTADGISWALSGANTLIKIDTNSDAIADMEILLTGNKLGALEVGDFIV